jgi:uncharacterized protein (DUF4415 family)
MARQRASQVRDRAAAAFGRVGTAQVDEVSADQDSSGNAGINAGENDSTVAISPAGDTASITDDGSASAQASGKASSRAGRAAGRKAGKKKGRRVGRPQGPERVAVTVRLLTSTNDLLTEAVEATGQNPQTIIEAALLAYMKARGTSWLSGPG